MSCHNIGHGLNEVVRTVLVEYDAGLNPLRADLPYFTAVCKKRPLV